MFKTYKGNLVALGAGILLMSGLLLVYAFINDIWLLSLLPFVLVIGLYVITDIELPFKFLLLAVPLSFPLEQLLPIDLDFPDEILQLAVTFLMLFYVLIKQKSYNRTFIEHPLIVFIIISFAWTFLCAAMSENIALSMKFVFKKIWYLVPFVFFAFGFLQSSKRIKSSFYLMFIPLLSLVILVMYRAKGEGFSFTEIHDPIQPFFRNHVMYGSMISSFIFWIIGAFCISKRLSSKLFFGLSIALFLVAIYFSYSRGAWAATAFGLGTMFMVRIRKMHLSIGLFYAVVLSLVIWLAQDNTYLKYRPQMDKTKMHETIQDHLIATLQGTDISSAERYYRWIAAIRLSTDYPVFGVGPNMFYSSYKPYAISEFRTWVSRNLEESTTHNYFLFMLVEQGYVGMCLYGLFICLIFWYVQRVFHDAQSSFDRNVILSTAGLLGAVFINNFFSELLETDKIGSLFFIGVTLIVIYDLKNRKRINNE